MLLKSHLATSGRQSAVSNVMARGRPRVAVQVHAWHNGSNSKQRRAENVAGDFYVDGTCIDCDTCRWMAPDTFSAINGQSAVHAQPMDRDGRVRALQALLSCPTNSIHVEHRDPQELKAAQEGLPALVLGCSNTYHCGWHSEKSFASASYLITRPGGNIMVDSPRWSPVLARQIAKLGGVKYMFLTHKDDVADHEKWHQHFGCDRIIHATEVRCGLQGVEIKLQGEGPWSLPDGGSDVELVFTPGHTSGHVCLYYAPDKALLTGDHLSADEPDGKELVVFTDFNWFSVEKQIESVAKLLDYDFLHILPGHGRPFHLRDAHHRLTEMTRLLRAHGADVPAPAMATH